MSLNELTTYPSAYSNEDPSTALVYPYPAVEISGILKEIEQLVDVVVNNFAEFLSLGAVPAPVLM